MGIIKSGILGGFSGKVGAVVGTSWKGKAIMRSQAQSVTNPRTTAQVENRNRFKYVFEFATSILSSIVKPLNDRFAQGMSGYNLFCSRNKGLFLADGEFVPANLVLSVGKLGDTVITLFDFTNEYEASVEYSKVLSGAYQSLTDKAYAVVVDNAGIVLGTSSAVATRNDEQVLITLNRALVGGEAVHAAIAFLRADGSMVGNTAHSTANYPL